MVERLARWALRRSVRDTGRLVWVDREGVAHDLGEHDLAALANVGDAANAGYRAMSTRERGRMAPTRAAAAKLAGAIRRSGCT